ncbi:MAG TPA: glycosyltransferase family 2 protein [bacterium]|nr:glycosyltransferase family 2 protein [bacterium]
MTKILAVIPAYNEAPRIAPVIEGILAHLPEVLVVDDASTDDTAEEAADAGALVLNLPPPNHGKGHALRQGFRYALAEGYDVVVTLDADGQHQPELIPAFLQKLAAGADLAYGDRLTDLGKMPAARIFSNRVTTRLVGFLAGARIEDSQCGMRAIRRWVLEAAVTSADRFAAESEQLVRAARAGAKLAPVTIPTLYLKDSDSKMRVVADTLRFVGVWFRLLGELW